MIAIMAAGKASRMETGGQWANKVLAEYDGEPLIHMLARRALASRAVDVSIVTGHDEASVKRAVNDLEVQFIHNPGFEAGVGTSIASAARFVSSLNSRMNMLLMFGDMPFTGTGHINTILNAANGNANQIFRGSDGPVAGHPIFFPSHYLPQLAELAADMGAKEMVQEANLVDIGKAATFDTDTLQEVRQAGGSPDFHKV
jgi:molybdenum cofactor cytidylyltransferase